MIDPQQEPSPHAAWLPVYMGLAFLGVLAIGVILGFLARPYIMPDRVEVVEVVATSTMSDPEAIAQAESSRTESAAEGQTERETDSQADDAPGAADPDAAPTPTIMDFLMSDARHVLGQADAPVTIIEFSDFR